MTSNCSQRSKVARLFGLAERMFDTAIPPNHGRVGLGSGRRCRTAVLVRLPAASGHRFSVDDL